MIKNSLYNRDEDIVALATPLGESAIAIIRTSGPTVFDKLNPLFFVEGKLDAGNPFKKAPHRQALFGSLVDPKSQTSIDEVVALVYHQPRGYTGENAVELMCHGSLPGIEMVLKLLQNNGFRGAAPGEFTFRAFMNGKLDLTQAEAVNELIHSRSRASHELALNRLSGVLSNQINQAKSSLMDAASSIAIQLDYPGDEIGDEVHIPLKPLLKAREIVHQLVESYCVGRLYKEGIRVVLCGKTNSGKSSLFNLFLKEDRSIVSEIHGTTRDYLESWITIDGIPVQLFDTAGIRETEDLIEAEGIKRTKEVMGAADFIFYVVDSTVGLQPSEKKWIDDLLQANNHKKDSFLLVMNKSDLISGSDTCSLASRQFSLEAIYISAISGKGFNQLEQWLVHHLKHRSGAVHEAVIDSHRQQQLLLECLKAIDIVLEHFQSGNGAEFVLDGVAVDLKEAVDCLGQLTGEVTVDDLLTQIFSNFCVGK